MSNYLNKTLAEMAVRVGSTETDILSHSRNTQHVDARSMVAALMKEQSHMRQQDIAQLLGITQAAVSKLLARHRNLVRFNAGYRRRWEEICPAEKHNIINPDKQGGKQ